MGLLPSFRRSSLDEEITQKGVLREKKGGESVEEQKATRKQR